MKKALFVMAAPLAVLWTSLISDNAYAASSDGIRHRTVTRTAVSGKKFRLGSSNLVTINCESDRIPEVIIRQAPLHGRVETVIEPDYAKGTGKYAKCRTRKIPSATIYYTSKPGYTGKDKIVIRVVFFNGQVDDNVVNMIVVK